MMTERQLAEAMERRLHEAMERELLGYYTTTSNANPDIGTTINYKTLAAEWDKQLRNFRRESITFIVDIAHPGPMIEHKTPCDGTRVELSYVQAVEVHKRWPLKLHKIISPDVAEFVPLSAMFGEFVPKTLPAPPYVAFGEETFEDWVKRD